MRNTFSLAQVAAVSTLSAAATAVAVALILRRRKQETYPSLVPPKSINEFEIEAKKCLSPLGKIYFGYVDGEGVTAKASRAFFASIRLLPRILVGDLSNIDTGIEIFGQKLDMPVLIAPTAFHFLACMEGEVATARGAAEAGAGYCYNWMLSSRLCSDVVEEGRTASGDGGVKWLHLYMFEEKELVEKAIKSAEATGAFSAIVLTCDHPHVRVQGRMLPYFTQLPFPKEALDRSFFPNQDSVGGDTITLRGLLSLKGDEDNVPGGTNSSRLSWEDVKEIKRQTKLPIVAKGVLSASDARKALWNGCDAIVVSNHGGRQFDGAPPAIEALPAVVAAVGGKMPVFVDTGVRSSTDVVKAICLGANGVLLGRPPLWALACGGSDSLRLMLGQLKDDIKADMMSLGVKKISELGPGLIWPPDRDRLDIIARAVGVAKLSPPASPSRGPEQVPHNV